MGNKVYLKPRPQDPLVPAIGVFPFGASVNCGYWYTFNPSGSEYKLAIVGTWEGNVSAIPSSMYNPNYWNPLAAGGACVNEDKTISVFSSGARCWRVDASNDPGCS